MEELFVVGSPENIETIIIDTGNTSNTDRSLPLLAYTDGSNIDVDLENNDLGR